MFGDKKEPKKDFTLSESQTQTHSSADDMMTAFDQKTLRKRSVQEQEQENAEHYKPASRNLVVHRGIKANADLFGLLAIVLVFTVFGYFVGATVYSLDLPCPKNARENLAKLNEIQRLLENLQGITETVNKVRPSAIKTPEDAQKIVGDLQVSLDKAKVSASSMETIGKIMDNWQSVLDGLNKITVGIRNIIELLVSLFLGLTAIWWSIYTPAGKIKQSLTGRANKPASQIDDWGQSVKGNKVR